MHVKKLTLIGRRLLKIDPDYAHNLLVEIEQNSKPALRNDFDRIPEILDIFCSEMNIESSYIQGDLLKTGEVRRKMECRKLFVLVILMIYDPIMITEFKHERLRMKLREHIRKVLGIKSSQTVSVMIYDALNLYSIKKGAYKDFSTKADLIYNLVKQGIMNDDINIAS